MQSYGFFMSRITGAAVLAALTTAVLLLLMNDLIKPLGDAPDAQPVTRLIEWVRLEELDPVKVIKEPPPVEPVEPPPVTTIDIPFDLTGGPGPDPMSTPIVDPGPVRSPGGLPDGDMLPIFKVAPLYPQRAATGGIEGSVLIRFTVDEKGRVIDPEVVQAHPPGIFNPSALQAVRKFKYKPRVLNGQAIRVTDVLHRLTYELDDS